MKITVDHFPIILENHTSQPEVQPLRWNFKKANWEKFRQLCQSKLIPKSNNQKMDLTTFFTETLLTIANESVPKMSPSIKKSKPWFDTECRKAVKIRRAALKTFQQQPTKENLNTFKNCRAKAC